jgi:hypothetical protein
MSESTVPIEAELTVFRPKLSKTRRRNADRYRCPLAASGRLDFPATGESLTVWLNNLSVTGIGMNVPRALEVGLPIVVRLRLERTGEPLSFPATVVHATPEVDGTWRIGCQFNTPLSEQTLDQLL